MQRDGKTPYKKVELRTKWVARLDENTMALDWTEEEKDELLAWAKKFDHTRARRSTQQQNVADSALQQKERLRS